jgi:Ribonuclease G/E
VNRKIVFKSRYAIVTPDAPGVNVARSIRDEDERERLLEVAHECLQDVPDAPGLILRSACNEVAAEAIVDDLEQLLQLAGEITAEPISAPGLLLEAPAADMLAWREWVDPDPDEVLEEAGSFERLGVWDHIYALRSPMAPLSGGASMIIEPTSALVAVDVNTGGDFSLTAGLKANLAAAADLPRQLRLRGLGGQITIDFAPSPKKDRRTIEQALRRALRSDSTETALVGWTPLGHFELQRKRERIPLNELLPE